VAADLQPFQDDVYVGGLRRLMDFPFGSTVPAAITRVLEKARWEGLRATVPTWPSGRVAIPRTRTNSWKLGLASLSGVNVGAWVVTIAGDRGSLDASLYPYIRQDFGGSWECSATTFWVGDHQFAPGCVLSLVGRGDPVPQGTGVATSDFKSCPQEDICQYAADFMNEAVTAIQTVGVGRTVTWTETLTPTLVQKHYVRYVESVGTPGAPITPYPRGSGPPPPPTSGSASTVLLWDWAAARAVIGSDPATAAYVNCVLSPLWCRRGDGTAPNPAPTLSFSEYRVADSAGNDVLHLRSDQQSSCAYGDGSSKPDISIPFHVDAGGPVDENGYPTVDSALYGNTGTVSLKVFDVDNKAPGIPERDVVSIGATPDVAGTPIGTLSGFDNATGLNSFDVSLGRLRPTSSVNPSGLNYLNIDVDANNDSAGPSIWCVGVRDVALKVAPGPVPVLLIHGFAVGPGAMSDAQRSLVAAGIPPKYIVNVGDGSQSDRFGGTLIRIAAARTAASAVSGATGHSSVNVIAHSFGGLVARRLAYILATDPQRPGQPHVNQMVQLGTPNGGNALADLGCSVLHHRTANTAIFGLNYIVARHFLEGKAGQCRSNPDDALYDLQQSVQQTGPFARVQGGTQNGAFVIAGDNAHNGLWGDIQGALLGGQNDTWVRVDSAFYWPRYEQPLAVYHEYHEQLHWLTSPALQNAMCVLYGNIRATLCLNGMPRTPPPPGDVIPHDPVGWYQYVYYNYGAVALKPHEGRFFPAPQGQPANLPWMTGDGTGRNLRGEIVFAISDNPDQVGGAVYLDTGKKGNALASVPLTTGSWIPEATATVAGAEIVPDPDGRTIYPNLNLINKGATTIHVIVAGVLLLPPPAKDRFDVAPSSDVVQPGQQVDLDVTDTGPLGLATNGNQKAKAPDLTVLDVSGNEVASLVPRQTSPGKWRATWTPPAAGTWQVEADSGNGDGRVSQASFASSDGAVSVLSGTGFAESTIDTNNDGLVGDLIVTPVVHVAASGDYLVSGELTDAAGLPVATGTAKLAAATGDQPAPISFSAADIYRSGVSGPYKLTHVVVTDANTGAVETEIDNVGTTAAYDVASFEHERVSVDATSISDVPQDTNQDGVFDSLGINGNLTVDGGGNYSIYGALAAGDGSIVADATVDGAVLNAGANPLSLTFKGADIAAAGKDGPYRLTLRVASASGGAEGDFANLASTQAYQAAQFGGATRGGETTNIAPPTIGGNAVEGLSLVGDIGLWHSTGGDPVTFAEQWERCDAASSSCAPIAAATTDTYTPVAADIGSRIALSVQATSGGVSSTAASEPTAVVLPAAPAMNALPSISGDTAVGATLTVSSGEWASDDAAPPTFAYYWVSCDSTDVCVDVGTDAPNYMTSRADAGNTIDVTVIATNSGGSTAVHASATAPIAAPIATAPLSARGSRLDIPAMVAEMNLVR
jgi:hypothetical protein